MSTDISKPWVIMVNKYSHATSGFTRIHARFGSKEQAIKEHRKMVKLGLYRICRVEYSPTFEPYHA